LSARYPSLRSTRQMRLRLSVSSMNIEPVVDVADSPRILNNIERTKGGKAELIVVAVESAPMEFMSELLPHLVGCVHSIRID
jgi:hypothetical protein